MISSILTAMIGGGGIIFAAWLTIMWRGDVEPSELMLEPMAMDADTIWGAILRDLRDNGPSTSEDVSGRLGGVANLNRRMYDLKQAQRVRELDKIGNAKIWELAA